MSFSLKIQDANFTNYIDTVFPLIEEATGFWMFDDDTSAKTNIIDNSVATVVGNPTVSNGIANLSGTDGYDTGYTIGGSDDYTMIAVGNVLSQGNSDGYVGTWHSGINAAKITSKVSHASGGGIRGELTVGVTNNLIFKAATLSRSESVLYVNDGVMRTDSGATVTNTSNTFRIGAMGLNSFTKHTLACVMLFPRALSTGEINDTYAFIKNKLAIKGVLIV